MAFQQGLSGLNSSSRQLDVIGNNIANSNTVGFKQARVEFADLYAGALTGAVGLQVGIGTKIADVSQQFTQGNVTVTNNPLDLSITGNGFFRMSQSGAISYQRNGQFQLDQNGFVINNTGQNLTGFAASATGAIVPGSPVNLQISTTDFAPQATSTAAMVANLDATKTAPAAAFDITDPTSFNDSTAFTTYDSLGNAHAGTLYFRKVAAVPPAASSWQVFFGIDGGVSPNATAATALTTLGFSTSGVLTSGGAPTSASFTPTGAAAQTVAFNFTGTSQFGSAFGITSLTQNGFTSGRLAGFDVDKTGLIQGRYTNGQTRNIGQVALASFASPQGLTPIGNNQWVETTSSGAPLVGAPNTGNLGVLTGGAVEDSNVDLTTELVNLIVAQRTFQANAQTITAQNTILQTLVNLG